MCLSTSVSRWHVRTTFLLCSHLFQRGFAYIFTFCAFTVTQYTLFVTAVLKKCRVSFLNVQVLLKHKRPFHLPWTLPITSDLMALNSPSDVKLKSSLGFWSTWKKIIYIYTYVCIFFISCNCFLCFKPNSFIDKECWRSAFWANFSWQWSLHQFSGGNILVEKNIQSSEVKFSAGDHPNEGCSTESVSPCGCEGGSWSEPKLSVSNQMSPLRRQLKLMRILLLSLFSLYKC